DCDPQLTAATRRRPMRKCAEAGKGYREGRQSRGKKLGKTGSVFERTAGTMQRIDRVRGDNHTPPLSCPVPRGRCLRPDAARREAMMRDPGMMRRYADTERGAPTLARRRR